MKKIEIIEALAQSGVRKEDYGQSLIGESYGARIGVDLEVTYKHGKGSQKAKVSEIDFDAIDGNSIAIGDVWLMDFKIISIGLA